MVWSFHPANREFENYADAWDRLNRAQFQEHPLLDSRFVGPLVEQFSGARTVLATHEEGGALQAGMLLEPRNQAIWSSFLPGQAQIAPAVVMPQRSIELLRDLMSSLPQRCWMLELLNQDWDFSCLREDSGISFERHQHATTMNVVLEGTFEAYWKARPRKLRENLRRYFNRVKKSGLDLEVRTLVEPGEMSDAVARYGTLESRGWKGARGTAVRRESEQGHFYASVMSSFAGVGSARVYELYLGNELAASRLLVSAGGMLVALKTTYDEELSRYAPGRLLQYSFLELEFERSTHKVVEFYTNATKETLEWASSSRSIYHVSLYRPGLKGAAVRTAQQFKAKVIPAPDAVAEPVAGSRDSSYVVDRIDTYEAFVPLEEEWNQCCARDGYDSIFLTHEWFDNFIREVIGDGAELAIFMIRRDGKLRAIFPMMTESMSIVGSKARCCRFLANFYSPVAKPIWGTGRDDERQKLARVFLDHVFARTPPIHLVDLNMLPEETDDRAILERTLTDMRVPYAGYWGSANWIQPTSEHTAETYAQILPSRVRNTVRRRLKKAESQGQVDCKVFTSFEDVTAHIDDYYSIYQRSWKRPEPYADFHRHLAENMAKVDKTILGIVYFDGKPVAAQIWLVHHGVASIVKLCYDEAYGEFSFGTILTYRLMSYVLDERRVKLVDYLTGDDAYKKDWMSVRRERRGVLGFNPNSRRAAWFAFIETSFKPRMKDLANKVRDKLDRTGEAD